MYKYCFILSFLFVGCGVDESNEEQISSEKESSSQYQSSSSIEQINFENKKIRFLGNSITSHPPLADVGWYNNCGMAASALENDYVHVLIDSIGSYHAVDSIHFEIANVGEWERTFDLQIPEYLPYLEEKPEVLIIRLGENVKEVESLKETYVDNLKKLVDYFGSSETKVFITGNFWVSKLKDSLQRKVALEEDWVFVDLEEVGSDSSNYATQEYDNYFVGIHPSDKGMKAIADAIMKSWRARFKEEI